MVVSTPVIIYYMYRTTIDGSCCRVTTGHWVYVTKLSRKSSLVSVDFLINGSTGPARCSPEAISRRAIVWHHPVVARLTSAGLFRECTLLWEDHLIFGQSWNIMIEIYYILWQGQDRYSAYTHRLIYNDDLFPTTMEIHGFN